MGMILLKATFEKYTTFAHTFVVVRDVVLTTRAELFHSPSLTHVCTHSHTKPRDHDHSASFFGGKNNTAESSQKLSKFKLPLNKQYT